MKSEQIPAEFHATPASIDAATGLRQGWDRHFKVPLLYQRSPGALRMRAGSNTVNSVPVASQGATLDWYAQLRRNPYGELYVHFNGADTRTPMSPYPRFARVRSLTDSAVAASFISIADPTVVMGREQIRLGWYLGGAKYDPLWDILKVIRKASAMTGAPNICLIGGSGGGLAALRVSAYLEGSLTYVQDPQTSVGAYWPRARNAYFRSLWPGWDTSKLLTSFPDRFNMVRFYRAAAPQNYVYYYQNRSDEFYVEKHYGRFRKLSRFDGETDVDKHGTRRFALVDGERAGHGTITHEEFERHLAVAVEWWRTQRGPSA